MGTMCKTGFSASVLSIAPNNLTPKNPCQYAGSAPAPSAYAQAGQAGPSNANNVLRIGWGWYGAHIIDNLPTGGEVFRVVVGCPSCVIHWHIWAGGPPLN